MFLRILKKDLKRKRAMNIILLVFIILSSLFVASSVNNIYCVTNALDNFLEISNAPDYFAAIRGKDSIETITDKISDVSEITYSGYERMIFAEKSNFSNDGEEIDFKNSSIIMSFGDAKTKYFDMDNEEITDVKEGTVVLSGKAVEKVNIETGDIITVKIGDKSLDLKVADSCKDAVLGSDLMGMTRFIMNEKDFEYFYDNDDDSVLYGSLWYINSTDTNKLNSIFSEINNVLFNADRSTIKMAYVLDMVIAGVFLVISVCLILVAFVVLKFTITFTLSEEFREIGVMKAIGIKNTKIRCLYLVKYLAMAVAGSTVGFFLSIPFSDTLLKNVSKAIVIQGENTFLINLICSIAVVLIILLFCYACTGKVKKLSPIDAIRNGQTGERYSTKSVISLSKTRGKPSFFMALNDILSAPKRFLSIIFTYILCMTIVLVLVTTTNTLRSGELVNIFGLHESDVFLSIYSEDILSAVVSGEREKLEGTMTRLETELEEIGIEGEASIELFIKYNLKHGDNMFKSMTLIGLNTTTDMYIYNEGTAPQNPNEVAITQLVAEKLDAEIGDTIIVCQEHGEVEYLVTGYYQSMNNLGEGVRFHQDAPVDFSMFYGSLSFQFDYTDSPDEKTKEERFKQIEDLYGEENVKTAGEFVASITGVGDAIDAIKYLTLGLVMVIIMLVTLLTERSFIAKEQGEIATLKAIGFNTSSVVAWHTLRFVIIGVVSSIIAVLISTPVTNLAITPVFKMMGAAYGVNYDVNLLEVAVIYPAILLVTTIISSVLTSLYTKTIKPSQASSIE